MNEFQQRDIFLGGESDAYFRRNQMAYAVEQANQESVALSVARRYVSSAGSALEIGCANGLNLERLRRATGCRTAGIDPSANAIESGKRDFAGIELRLATADALPFEDHSFDLVWFGFCLYVTDRAALPRIVQEADRVLKDGGYIMIVDFDPAQPVRVKYAHAAGISSYKADYSRMFLGFPQYALVEKKPFSHAGASFVTDANERLAVQVLHKNLSSGYSTP